MLKDHSRRFFTPGVDTMLKSGSGTALFWRERKIFFKEGAVIALVTEMIKACNVGNFIVGVLHEIL